jgi:hypothetical protein
VQSAILLVLPMLIEGGPEERGEQGSDDSPCRYGMPVGLHEEKMYEMFGHVLEHT